MLAELPGIEAFGIAGPTMRASMRTGDALEHIERLNGMGILDVARRARTIAQARTRVLREAERRRPRAAVLFNYSEFCTSLLAPLRALGIHTVFYSPPQVWAWRKWRTGKIARAADHILVTLPFEEAIWRHAGARVTYVGHPGYLQARVTRRTSHGTSAPRIAILPGSRPREAESLQVLLTAARLAGIAYDQTCVLAAPSLSVRARRTLQRRAERAGVSVANGIETLPDFDAALCYSGTATLDCALAEVPPVIVGPSFPGAALLARALLHTNHIGLPNVLLGRRAFPEHFGNSAAALAESLHSVLSSLERGRTDCACVRELLQTPEPAHVRTAQIMRELL
jgi:lipid-A-disaccharide synthase